MSQQEQQIQTLLAQAQQASQANNINQAISICNQALSMSAEHPDALYCLGMIHLMSGNATQALEGFQRALRQKNRPHFAHHAAVAFCQLGQFDKGIEFFQRAWQLGDRSPGLYTNLGLAYEKSGQLTSGIEFFQQLLQQDTNNTFAQLYAGRLLLLANEPVQAINHLKGVVEKSPENPNGWFNLGTSFQQINQLEAAEQALSKAAQLRPNHDQTHNNLGVVLEALKKYQQANTHYRKALEINPKTKEAWKNLGNLLRLADKLEDSKQIFKQGLSQFPDDGDLKLGLYNVLRFSCDWDEAKQYEHAIVDAIDNDNVAVMPDPFTALCMKLTPGQQQKTAQVFAEKTLAGFVQTGANKTFDLQRIDLSRRIKVGYVSANFRDHATAHNVAGLFPLHDKNKYEIFAFSVTENDGSDYRLKVEQSVDHFIDLSRLTAEQAAKLIEEHNIDVLINMMGYTQYARSEIFALRPSPVQINFQGFPGTMGAAFMDYIITDQTVMPEIEAQFYDEAPIYMPHQYFAVDTNQLAAQHVPSKWDCKLPDDKIIFACFSGSGKIDESAFSCWMEILKQVEDSVLWLYSDVDQVQNNLRLQAEKLSIDQSRLIFAQRKPKAEHLARHVHINLFLDSFVYNAHTTAADALMMGIPVLTLYGQTWVSRVAASLNKSAEIPELITYSQTEFINKACELAQDKEQLAQLKNRLKANKQTAPLFDRQAYISAIEDGCMQAIEAKLNNGSQNPIHVKNMC